MKRIYHPTSKLIYKNIQQDSDVRLIYFSGMGSPIRSQREAFLRRFALTQGISYLALDYTNYAKQFKAKDDFNVSSFFDKTEEILKKFPDRKFLFMGGCFGGLMALEMAKAFPQKVVGIVASSPLYETPEFLYLKDARLYLHKKAQRMVRNQVLSFNRLKELAFLDLFFASISKGVSKRSVQTNYTGPVTLIHGEKDQFIPVENSFHIQKGLNTPHAQVRVIPNTKHTFLCDKEMKTPIAILKGYLSKIKSPQ